MLMRSFSKSTKNEYLQRVEKGVYPCGNPLVNLVVDCRKSWQSTEWILFAKGNMADLRSVFAGERQKQRVPRKNDVAQTRSETESYMKWYGGDCHRTK